MEQKFIVFKHLPAWTTMSCTLPNMCILHILKKQVI